MWYNSLAGVLIDTYDLEGVGDDADSHKLLAVVATVHHERVGEALNDRALGLPEALDSIAAGGVGDVHGLADLDVVAAECVSGCALVLSYTMPPICVSCIVPPPPPILRSRPFHLLYRTGVLTGGNSRQGDVPDLDILVAPLVEQLDAANLLCDVLGQDGVALGRLDFDLAVRHLRD